jgi:polar amino acid transport system substrate-binding protein
MRRKRLAASLIVLAIACVLAAAADDGVEDGATAKVMAPTGKLRVGLYRGSPTSILPGENGAEARGVGYELGRALAAHLGVPFEPVIFAKNADVLAAIKTGSVDILFTNATAERARDMDFSETFLRVEQGCLVPAGSRIAGLAEVDAKGVRIGVSAGSTSEKVVPEKLKNAQVVVVPTLARAVEMLKSGELDAFATNKAILYELSDQVPGSKVLAGAWGYENYAAGMPKGRAEALPALNHFLREEQRSGKVREAVEHAGLRGTVPPEQKARRER